jgi:hypothetical protein
MLALALTLALAAAPDPGRSARLLTTDEQLTPADVEVLDRELRVTKANILELKPHLPTGYVIGMAFGFAFAVLLLPGIPLMIIGATASSFASGAMLLVGGLLTGVGGVSLLFAIICAVLGNNAESDMADDRARLVERRDALEKRLAPWRQQPQPVPTPLPGYVPGVRLELPPAHLVTLARF